MVQFLVRLSLCGRTLGEGPSDGLEEPDVVADALPRFVRRAELGAQAHDAGLHDGRRDTRHESLGFNGRLVVAFHVSGHAFSYRYRFFALAGGRLEVTDH